jgi:hypothetical protein
MQTCRTRGRAKLYPSKDNVTPESIQFVDGNNDSLFWVGEVEPDPVPSVPAPEADEQAAD